MHKLTSHGKNYVLRKLGIQEDFQISLLIISINGCEIQ